MASLFRTSTSKVKASTALSIQTSVNGMPIPVVYGQARLAGNLIWYGDFKATKQSNSTKGGKGGSSSKGSGSYRYSAAVMIGICRGTTSVLKLWDGSTADTLGSKDLTAFSGAADQAPWGYLTSLHPTEAVAYRGLCYVAAGPMDLGQTNALPSLNFEVKAGAGLSDGASGIPDANPAAVLTDIVSNPVYGLPYTVPYLGDLSGWASYCLALGLLVSPAYSSARSGQEILKELTESTNSEIVWSGGALTVIPRGDATVTGNGASWSPPPRPLFTLTVDDLILGNGDFPIDIKRKRPEDAKNVVRVEYFDRTRDYNSNIVEAIDEALVDLYGRHASDTRSWHHICLSAAAQMAAELALAREALRATYSLSLGPEYILLDLMDVVSLDYPPLGLSGQWVRIVEISEDEGGRLDIVAEEVLDGTGGAPAYAMQANTGHIPNYNVAPPTSNAPIVLAAPPEVAQGLELWLVASGPAGWGGCHVWVSGDGNSYTTPGGIEGGCLQGVLTAALPIGADPDVTNALTVDLTMSDSALVSYSQADADLYRSLCYVCDPDGSNGEFIAYRSADLVGSNVYQLTYLRRGLYGSQPVAHAAGSRFARLDGRVMSIGYTSEQIGTAAFIKLTAYNLWGGGEEDVADVDATQILLPAPPVPGQIEAFSVSQSGSVTVFGWTRSTDWALAGYSIFFESEGGSGRTMLTTVGSGTEMTNAAVPPGTWRFGIYAVDQFGQAGEETYRTATITASGTIIASAETAAPLWTGTIAGLLQRYTGELIPDSRRLASEHTNAELFEKFVPYPVAAASLTLDVIDTGVSAFSLVYPEVAATPGRGLVGAVVAFYLDAYDDVDAEDWQLWVGGSATARRYRGRFAIPQEAPCVFSGGKMTISGAPSTTTFEGVSIPAGGLTVAFGKTYRSRPNVSVTPGAGCTGGAASSITSTSAHIELFSGSTSVAGTADITIIGA